jgi:hypothetical protein
VGCLLLALGAQDVLLARIVHVVLGRRCDLTLRVVAHHAILPTLQLVRDLGRQVDQEGGRLGKAGWRVAGVTLAGQVVLRRFMAVAADEYCAGSPRPQGRENDDGLHPRPQPGRLGRSQSLGLTNSRGLNLATHSFRHGVVDWATTVRSQAAL